ncbi:uncharacterized protein TNCV_3460831 [Trichonephila clavipes]|nr:uncharacterized protein TNCV_3460831 [Trichonephila clavipes]
MLDITKYPPSAHGFTCRNCGGGDRGRVVIYRPFGEVSLSLNRTVTCMVLKANDRRTSCPCHDEFRGPRSDYVRQVALATTTTTDNIIRCDTPLQGSTISSSTRPRFIGDLDISRLAFQVAIWGRELDLPLTELQTVCDVGWTHRGHEQLVMEYEAILRGERSLMPKS